MISNDVMIILDGYERVADTTIPIECLSINQFPTYRGSDHLPLLRTTLLHETLSVLPHHQKSVTCVDNANQVSGIIN